MSKRTEPKRQQIVSYREFDKPLIRSGKRNEQWTGGYIFCNETMTIVEVTV